MAQSSNEMVFEELRKDHKPGDLVCWTLLNGNSYRGTLVFWDLQRITACVECDNKQIRFVNAIEEG